MRNLSTRLAAVCVTLLVAFAPAAASAVELPDCELDQGNFPGHASE